MQTSAIKIDSGVPMPSAGRGVATYLKALAEAGTGDSVLIPRSLSGSTSYRQFATNVSSQANRIFGAGGFKARRDGEDVRVWKIG